MTQLHRAMPSRRTVMFQWVLPALAAGLSPFVWRPAQAQTWDLNALMALLAQRKSGQARFTEERTVSGFDSPLRASGTLSFSAPDRFARQTMEPRPESMEVAGNQLVLVRGGRTRHMTLDAVPEVAGMVHAVRGTLAGNGALLRKNFQTAVTGHAARWTLTLTPLPSAGTNAVRSVQIAGTGPDVRSVELLLTGGDRSVMSIEPLPANTPLPGSATSANEQVSSIPRPATAPRAASGSR